MAQQSCEQLPSELVKEILCRLPTKSLAPLRALSKQWNAIWEDKSFLNMYFAHVRPQFILWTKSHICSVDINLNVDEDDHVSLIEVREIALDDIPCRSIVHCEGFLLSDMCKKGLVVWNPWLRQSRCVVPEEKTHGFRFCGVGYDNTKPLTGFKIFGYSITFDATRQLCPKLAIYDCKSNAWKFINAPCQHWRVPQLESVVSLKGSLYWMAYDSKTCEQCIRSFDFSSEKIKTFCILPCDEDFGYTKILAVFMGDRFSVLRQSYMTRKVDILVTKHKINGNGRSVEWMSFMTVSIPDFPMLQDKCLGSQPSYFVDGNKRLIVCTCDDIGHACIYIVKGDVFRKIVIDSMVDPWPSHLTYIPSFVPIRILQRQEHKLQDYL